MSSSYSFHAIYKAGEVAEDDYICLCATEEKAIKIRDMLDQFFDEELLIGQVEVSASVDLNLQEY